MIEKEFGKLNPLDESLYKLDENGLAFMKRQTGIDDEEELKKHILAVQAEAYQVSLSSSLDSLFVVLIVDRLNGDPDPPLSVHSAFRISTVSLLFDCGTFFMESYHDPSTHRCKLARLPAYKHLLALGKERQDPIFLDIGCCCKCPDLLLCRLEG